MKLFFRREHLRTIPLSRLREKWVEVPGASQRFKTSDLLKMPISELVEFWQSQRKEDTEKDRFSARGWYHLLYKDVLRGKIVADVGSGMGIDGITFAQSGAKVVFVDIVEDNLSVIKRLCAYFGLSDVEFLYLDELNRLSDLCDLDVIWCQGSMINAPFEMMQQECSLLLKHLKIGGRWIELAYPKERWLRDGKPSFQDWGNRTDGEGTPWMEWYDLKKLLSRLQPARFRTVLHFNFANSNFNWFDLQRVE